MGTCLELLLVALTGMLAARLLAPFWPNHHVYGGWDSLLVDPLGLDLADTKLLLNRSSLKSVICHFDNATNSTAQEDLRHLTRLFEVADGKHVVVIMNRFEHLSLFSQVTHEDVRFVYEIKESLQLDKWAPGNFCTTCNVTLRITPELYQLVLDGEYSLKRHVIPSSRNRGLIELQLVCPKPEFWEVGGQVRVKEEQIGVYRDISSHLIPEAEFNISGEKKKAEV